MTPTSSPAIAGFRLSPQQHRLWSLQHSSAQLPPVAQATLQIMGALQLDRLQAALLQVVQRHEILRTRFPCLPGMQVPLQVIEAAQVDWQPTQDLQIFDPATQAARVEASLQSLVSHIDVSTSPVVRSQLLQLAKDRWVLHLALPALSADAYTLRQLVQDLRDAYTAVTHLPADELPQYADLAEWQHELLTSDETAEGRSHWQQQSFREPRSQRLPWEIDVDGLSTFQPQRVVVPLESTAVAQFAALAAQQQTSLEAGFLTLWSFLIARHLGHSSVVGVAAHGRKYPELEAALGPLTRYLPVAIAPTLEQSFSAALRTVDQTLQNVHQWQEYFDPSLLSVDPLRGAVGFAFEPLPQWQQADGVAFYLERSQVYLEPLKLQLTILHQGETCQVELHYDANRFSSKSITLLAEQFQTLLNSVLQSPTAAIASLNLVSEGQRQQLLIEWNQTHTPFPRESTIHHLFEQQADRTPDQPAVVFETRSLTYAELNAEANRLAHYLRAQGIQPDQVIGLATERSLEFIIGLLSILKAGGAYLPLDVSLPTERLSGMLEDAQAQMLLTHTSELERWRDRAVQVITLDQAHPEWAHERSDNLSDITTAENLAYVIYTSGSTGRPKGVAVEHRSVVNYLYGVQLQFQLPTPASFALVSTIAADLGHTMIFSSLCFGGYLHLIAAERATNPEAIADYFFQHPVDCLKIVPSHLAALLTTRHPERLLPRHQLILGGEAASGSLVAQIRTLAPTCHILNHYGPTETTVGVLTYAVPHSCNLPCVSLSLGRPLANTQVYLLDAQQGLVPPGVVGELYIGGEGVARGYLHQPDLTAERFIPLPASLKTERAIGQRLYRTGDLARYQLDGTLEFLGRADDQVKIRGYRIELGEIAAVIQKHPAVREQAVIVRHDERGTQHIVAYIVQQPEQSLTDQQLRQFLAEHLPDYMMPAAVVWLPALPLTPNGKIDCHALPAPSREAQGELRSEDQPQTSLERRLAAIWSDLFGLESIGRHDNFFELGGDSILSMQIIARASRNDIHITPKQVFEYPTIAQLATVAESTTAVQAEQGLVRGSAPLTPVQQWFFAQPLANPHHWNQSVLLELCQPLDASLIQHTLRHLLHHHDALRLQFRQTETGWEAVHGSAEQAIAFCEMDWSALPPEEQMAQLDVFASDLQASMNLAEAPLMRVALLHLSATGDGQHSACGARLLWIAHHLIVDGVSWRILLEDFQTVYQQLSQGQAVQLPDKTTSWQQWGTHLQDYAQSEAAQQELPYWLGTTPSIPRVLQSAADVSHNTGATAQTITIHLTPAETQCLLQELPARHRTQIQDVLLTALLQTFRQCSGEKTLYLDVEGHGRTELFPDLDVSRTVGWFTTLFPVQLTAQETALVEVLQSVKDQLQSIPHQGIGYGLLRYLNTDQTTAALRDYPSASVRFNYLGQLDRGLQTTERLKLASEPAGIERSLRNPRPYLLDISGYVAEGLFQMRWSYSHAIHDAATIQALADTFLAVLRSLLQSTRESPPHAPQEPIRINSMEDLTAEVILDANIHPNEAQPAATGEPQAILVTGATGFLGAALVAELLQKTSAQIYCLSRAENGAIARQRLQQNLNFYQLWNAEECDRLIPVVGDLAQPYLGLTKQDFQHLAQVIDVIYHNGAWINLVYPYATLKAANVLGTQEILRLACQSKVKPVHLVSTLSVIATAGRRGECWIQEQDRLDAEGLPATGYAQTKWVAEQLARIAQSRGLPVSIYRAGRISGHRQTGICNTSDRLYRMIKGCIQLGAVPDVDLTLDMTPVDYMAQAIVHLSQQDNTAGQVFHLSNPQPIELRDLAAWIRTFGYPLETLPYDAWHARLMQAGAVAPDNALYPLIPFFAEQASKTTAVLRFDDHNTRTGLANSGITCPPVNETLLETYFSYLIRSEFLPVPTSSSALAIAPSI